MSDRLVIALAVLVSLIAVFAGPADDSDAAVEQTATVTADGEVSGVLKAQCVAGAWETIGVTAVLSPSSSTATASFTAGAVSDGLEVSVEGYSVKFRAAEPGDYHFTVSASVAGYSCAPLNVQVTATSAGAYTHVIYFINSVGGGEFEGTRMAVTGTSGAAKAVTVEFPDVSNFGYTLDKWTIGKDGETVDHTAPCTLSVPANGYVSLVSHWILNTVTVEEIEAVSMSIGETAEVPLKAVYSAFDPSRPSPAAEFTATPSSGGITATVSGGKMTLAAETAGTYTVEIAASADGYQTVPLSLAVTVAESYLHPITFADGDETLAVQKAADPSPGAIDVEVSQPDATKAGKKLAGWSYEAGGEAEVRNGDTISVGTDGVTLYAVWEDAGPVDWIPWALIALGIILALLGYFRCFPLLIPVGIAPIVLGACELLGVTNFF
ncbi:MAG: InlB B-repeat-containing protein [Candidatus Methanomethylophilaceae archaeon]|nr:InlB B-repeat-containing protein [Candidatus Methanomethylophilaceae archaeon]